jgi:amidophosphoribosyltransferase
MKRIKCSELREECGVFGILAPDNDVVSSCYYGLYALQHRGQEGCGIVVSDGKKLKGYKDVGLVNDVFTRETLNSLGSGTVAIGHVRCSDTSGDLRLDAQPMIINQLSGAMALAHNGRLINASALRRELESKGAIFHTTSDSEVIAYVIIKERLAAESLERAVLNAMPQLKGAYSIVIMSNDKLIAVRDPLGFRPLCIGTIPGGGYVIASESCALDSINAAFLRDVEPGEVIIINENGLSSERTHINAGAKAVCSFEHIYFARSDSIIDGSPVSLARQRAGEFLALDHPVEADVVIGVPDSGLDAAIGYARQSGIPYDIGFIKNRYVGRTFLSYGQSHRQDRVRIKLNVIASAVRGKRVIMIDDSIVRGTTSCRIVKLLRDAGAARVHMRVTSPPFRNPCYYGTDISTRENLIACQHTVEEIARMIGVDTLGYLNAEHIKTLAGPTHWGYCDACFTGSYPTSIE